jgi:hypothetical protein
VPPVTLRPRSTTELIDAAVSLLRQHYLELVTANALFTIPFLLFSVVYAPFLAHVMPQPGAPPDAIQASAFPPSFLASFAAVMLGSAVCGAIANATTVVIVSDNYLGAEVTISSALQRALGRFWAVFFTGLLQGLAIALGFLCFFIPGFFCLAWFFAAVNVVMVEGLGPIAALRRSRALARGSVGHILGTIFLCGLVVMIVQGVARAVVGVLIGFTHPSAAVTALIGNVIGVLVFPFFTVMTTLLYYDLRIRKEGFDLDLMAKELRN